ncbi:MAG: DUF4190 domain-containing protein [Thermoguttaceae bacterium]
MPIRMNCESCNKSLSAPDTAAGKKAKCPACGTVMIVPIGVFEDQEFGAASPEPPAHEYNMIDDILGTTPSQSTDDSPGSRQEPARRACPMCGEQVVAAAAKCRFCGAVFDPRLAGSPMHRGKGYQGFAVTSMVLGIVGIFAFCFGILFGVLAVIFGGVALNGMTRSRNSEGKGMAITGLVLGIIECGGWGLWYLLIIIAAIGSLPRPR